MRSIIPFQTKMQTPTITMITKTHHDISITLSSFKPRLNCRVGKRWVDRDRTATKKKIQMHRVQLLYTFTA